MCVCVFIQNLKAIEQISNVRLDFDWLKHTKTIIDKEILVIDDQYFGKYHSNECISNQDGFLALRKMTETDPEFPFANEN